MSNQFNVNLKKIATGTAIALVANAVIFFIGSAAAATWSVGTPFKISLPIVAFATVFPMLLGGVVVRALAKWKQGVIAIASWFVLIFSIAGAPGGYIASMDLPTGLALGTMHFVVGLTWFFAIRNKK